VLLGGDDDVRQIARALQKIAHGAEELARLSISPVPSLEDCDE
jgi:hypothetical protein